MYVCSWIFCLNLKNVYISWKILLFLCIEKLMICREDKLVFFISCRNLMFFIFKYEYVIKKWFFKVNNLKFGILVI